MDPEVLAKKWSMDVAHQLERVRWEDMQGKMGGGLVGKAR
jgi:hypothetical protein